MQKPQDLTQQILQLSPAQRTVVVEEFVNTISKGDQLGTNSSQGIQ